VIPLNLVALEINHCGEIFAAGFTLSNKLGEWFGDTNLYRVDRKRGSLSLIGDTGLVKIMDLAFDPNGTLWATVGNVLYTLDMETGAPTEVVTITGVEKNNEIMGIGFTSDGILYGTTPYSDGFYRIDPASGFNRSYRVQGAPRGRYPHGISGFRLLSSGESRASAMNAAPLFYELESYGGSL
jgi:streptogramin lyase